jgi:hypothetical protein
LQTHFVKINDLRDSIDHMKVILNNQRKTKNELQLTLGSSGVISHCPTLSLESHISSDWWDQHNRSVFLSNNTDSTGIWNDTFLEPEQ